ncbi:hypothetical protein [uncultured Flavobacterium sp.]|uniref:hypothetical protein n=1 Tax=uncultured Flavobacterium sp. TaxID=165435 RepID=UPI0030EF007A|tara:strand:- start:19565 stop:19984 length:420 start_codon:yes stop_codon:yes gene_type:complete
MRGKYFLIGCIAVITLSSCTDDSQYTSVVSNKIAITTLIFFDSNLSKLIGQAGASYHAAQTDFSDLLHPELTEGALTGRFSSINSSRVAHNVFAPEHIYNSTDQLSFRNIALSAPYFHNGSFKTVKEVIPFYNVRDISP